MSQNANGKLIVFAAPSGAGKSTIAKSILNSIPNLVFSVSATTRAPRLGEENGREYYFLSKDDFEKKVKENDFIEHETFFYNHYGTLKSKTDEIISSGKNLLLDLDVRGALNVKRLYSTEALLIFILPPSIEALKKRLIERKTETPEMIEKRLERAKYELSFSNQFDVEVVNDNLEKATTEVKDNITKFLNQ